MKLYRVFPYARDAAAADSGGALFIPPGGHNRIDSPVPGEYSVLYAADKQAAAIAEAFGVFLTWDADLIEGVPALLTVPASRWALATYDLPDSVRICDMDDAKLLLSLSLRPSQVVTRDRRTTQRWAEVIHSRGEYGGISWWSYYSPDWRSLGIWQHDALSVVNAPLALRVDDPNVALAAKTICRRLK